VGTATAGTRFDLEDMMSEQEDPIVGSGAGNKPETTESTATGSSLPTPATEPSESPQDGRSESEQARGDDDE
jgi:hypothetical protein